MKKYLLVFYNTIQQFLAYRLNFILWRVRVVLSVLISYFLWKSVFMKSDNLFNYNQMQILTYIILLSFVQGVVLSTQTPQAANEINLGFLSNYLLLPISYIRFNLFRDLADKLVNTIFSIAEVGLLLFFLRPPFFIQINPILLILFFLSLIFSAILFFEISLILSFIGFWSKETWGPRFVFFILVAFLSGIYFPLDVLPKMIFNILEILPFTYLVFFPLKIYLGQSPQFMLIKGFGLVCFWIVLMYILLIFLWRKGLRSYTSEGR